MAERVQAYDWSATPLGPLEAWPQSLRTAVDVMLGSHQPVYVAWGPELTSLYNDGYLPIVGAKHPMGLGQPFEVLWSEILEEYRPLVDAVMSGEAQHFVDRPAALAGRKGVEVGYFTFSWTPLRDEVGVIRGFICNGVETTERVEAGRAFRRLFDASPTPFLVLAPDAPDFTIVEVNDAYLAAVMRTREGLLGRGLFEAMPDNPTDPDATGVANLRASLERALATRRPDRMARQKYDIPHPGGGFEQRWWDPVNSPLLAANGEVEALIHHVVDVTERHQTEERLRVSEARLAALTRATSNVLYRMSPDWGEMRELEGGGFLADTSDPTRAWLMNYIPEDERTRVTAAIEEAICAQAVFELEHRVVRADGTVGWTRSRAVPILGSEGEIIEWFGAATDVTAQHEAEVALQQSEARHRATLEQQVAERTAERDRMWNSSPDLMLIVDFNGVFRDVNPSWTRILGYAADELRGRHANAFVLPEDHAETIEAYELAAAGGLPALQNRYRHKDGSVRWISWTAAPAGDMTYAIGRDVTAERQQALDLRETQDALRQSQKMEAVGQLTGGVAHDFNNLLTVIRGSVDMLRRDTLAPDKRARFLDAIGETADRAAKLTGQLLAFARRQTLKPEVFNVADRIAAISDMLDSVTGNRIRIETRVPTEPCLVRADVSQFETALVNMAVNARDAMDGEGSLTITLECGVSMPAIRGHGGSDGRFISVALTDTGSGMPPETMNQIFEPFFTTKEVGKGTGLGLSQVFGFAKQSGGDVDVFSELGTGSTFVLYLPGVEDGSPAVSNEAAHEPSAEGQGLCVLVVEDNVEVGRFTTQTLQEYGYRTTLVANAEAALQALGTDGSDYDIVFSDIVMPGMGGIELARRLARDMPHMPLVLASGYSHVLASGGAGEFELLQKPYSTEELSRTLRRVVLNGARGAMAG